jgi:alpha-galactosidase
MHFKRVTYLSPCQKGLFVLQAIAILLLLPPVLKAASNDAPIRYLPEAKIFIMETDHTSYVFGINEQNALQNLYWGKKISREDDFSQAHTAETRYPLESKEGMTNEEYAGWGGMRYTISC